VNLAMLLDFVFHRDILPADAARRAVEAGGRAIRNAGGMSIALYRLDDRLIHGQVVVGWGKR